MVANEKIKINITIAILLTVVLPIVSGYLLTKYFQITYISLPLHSALEVSGGMIAIVISMIYYLKYSKNHIITYFNWSTTALLAMGIIDIFHGIMMPGKLFVWLHSTAVFFGGLLFISVWLKNRYVSQNQYKLIPKTVIFFSIFFSLFSITFPDLIPEMFNSDKTFSDFANTLNIIGGIGFFIASLKFLINYAKYGILEDLLFAGHTLLFGIAGVLFVSSVIWDMQWWLWHILRLLAYSIALYFLYIEFGKEIKLIENKNHQLDLANKRINKYLDIVDKNVITSSTDTNGIITNVSDAFCKISGFSRDELIGKNHRIVKHTDMEEQLYIDLWETISSDKVWKGEIKNRKRDGGYYWVYATISPVFDEKNKKVGYTAIRQDITDKKIIEEISITDGLTGIYNRRHFNELFPKVINIGKRTNELICFMILDVDHFKQFNDTYGHHMGDEVLIKVANSIKSSLKRTDDYCFRLGGEEFGVIVKADSQEKGYELAEQIRENIKALNIEHSKNSAGKYVSVSVGLVCKRANDITGSDEIYKQADDLLYEAKESGRDRVCCIK